MAHSENDKLSSPDAPTLSGLEYAWLLYFSAHAPILWSDAVDNLDSTCECTGPWPSARVAKRLAELRFEYAEIQLTELKSRLGKLVEFPPTGDHSATGSEKTSSLENLIAEEYYFTAGHGTWAARCVIYRDHVTPLNRQVFCTIVTKTGLVVSGEALATGSKDGDLDLDARQRARTLAVRKLLALAPYDAGACTLAKES